MVELYRAAGEERGLSFEVDERTAVTAEVDPDLFHRALANLLDNALGHLPPGCRVVVSAGTDGPRAVLSVADDGPGFPPEVRGQAFERWAKGASSDGFGIGLALVRSVARAHGGDAEIVDRPDGGAVVRLWFPRRPASTRR